MKKLNLAIILALGLVVPFSAMATDSTDEVTIRMMNRFEYSTDNVTKNIELPDAASDQAELKAFARKTVRVRDLNADDIGEGPGEGYGISAGDGDGSGPGPGAGFGDGAGDGYEGAGPGTIEDPDNGLEAGDLDRDRTRDQDMEYIQDQDQDRDRIRDAAELEVEQEQNEVENNVEDLQTPGNEAPGENQQGPGSAG